MLTMKRTVVILLVALGLMACEPASTGDTKEKTPTPAPTPSPTPVPVLDSGYHLVAMRLAATSSEALDITGDGKTDNGMPGALKAISSFLTSRLRAELKELQEAGTISDEQYLALSTAMTAAVSSIFSTNTVNRALEDAMKSNNWLQRTKSSGPGTVMVGYYYGDSVTGGYLVTDNLGELAGNYFQSANGVDAKGPYVSFALTLTSGELPTAVDFSFQLQDSRAVNLYSVEAIIDGQLAGGISTQEYYDLVNDVLGKLTLLPFLDAATIKELQKDLKALLDDMSDVTLSTGEPAISTSLIYSAEGAPVSLGY